MIRIGKQCAPRPFEARIIDAVLRVLVFILLLLPISARSQAAFENRAALRKANVEVTSEVTSPEIVQLEKVRIENDVKTLIVGNAKARYLLMCSMKAQGCITPAASKNYLLFNKETRWRRPGATGFISLQFMQDWTVSYNDAENIGLLPEESDVFGVYWLDKKITKTGYNQDIITSDGPIIYGTGMNEVDRKNA